jgi:3-methyl-2-oxobutanoate hydroxymethyltransferase
VPRHAKQYAKLADIIRGAVADYSAEVKAGSFPTPKHGYTMNESLLAGLKKRAKATSPGKA